MFIIEGKAGSGVSQKIVKLLNNFELNTKVLILDESSQGYIGINDKIKLKFLELTDEGITFKELYNIAKDYDIVVINTAIINLEKIISIENDNSIFIAKVQLPMDGVSEDTFLN